MVKLFEGLKLNLKTLISIIEDVIKGKEAFSLKKLHCYSFEVKKRCPLSVLLAGITFKLGFREKKVIQKGYQSGDVGKTLKLFFPLILTNFS